MKNNLLKLLTIAVLFSASNAVAQHLFQVDDGLGHYSWIMPPNPGNTFILPPVNGGTILTFTPGISPAWLTGGNTNPVSNILGTTSANDLSLGATGITRATFAYGPSATTPMLTIQNTTPGIQGVRINGFLDATGASTLAANPGVWDLVVEGDQITTGILKTGGSLWVDGNSSTHTITANKPLNINTKTNDSITFGTNGLTRMTIGKSGFVGVGTQNPVSAFHVVGTPPTPTFTSPAGFLLPDPNNHVMTVENLDALGKGNGIAVIIHNPASADLSTDGQNNDNRSNYMTFYNDIGDHNHIKGRIEGFSYQNYIRLKQEVDSVVNVYGNASIYNPLNYFTFNVGYNSSWLTYHSDFLQFTPPTLPTFNTGSLPSINFCNLEIGSCPLCITIPYPCGFSGGSWPSFSGGSIGSLSVTTPFTFESPLTNLTNPFSVNYTFINNLANEFKDFPYKQTIITAVTQPLVAAVDFGLSFLGQVTYESGSGDYAEWLERGDHNEKISIGDVVGVIGDKISKNTEVATHLMVVSWKPCVLGNTPPAGSEDFYQKVAFMGQIPVKMVCAVKKGDYVIADGHNNGFAKAISPKDITVDELGKVVGVAWDDAPNVGVKMVKIAVGLKPHEIVKVIQDQEKEIGTLETKLSEVASLKAELAEITNTIHSAHSAKLMKKKAKHSKALSSN